MPLRLTRRAIFEKFADGGLTAIATCLALSGCSDKPKEQPTTNPPDTKAAGSGGKDMRKYVCGKCGNVYDPAASDPAKPFPDLPDDWKCPKCGSPKSRFSPKT